MSSSSSDSGGFLDINPQQHGNSFSDIYKKLLTMVESFDPLNAITPAPSLPDISNYTIAPPPLPPPSDLGTAKSRKDATAPGLEKEMEEFLQLDFIDWNVTESGKFESGTTTKKESNQIPATVPVVEPQVQRALTDSELPAQPELIVKPSTPVPPRTLPRLEMPKTFLPVEPEHLPSQSSLPVTQPKPVPPSTPVVPPKSPKLQPQPPKSPQPQCIQCNKRVSAFFFVDRCQHKLCEEVLKLILVHYDCCSVSKNTFIRSFVTFNQDFARTLLNRKFHVLILGVQEHWRMR